MDDLRQANAELRARNADLLDALWRIERWAQNVEGLSAEQVAETVRRMASDGIGGTHANSDLL